jgi:YVTN family beta-propeller protein
MRLLFISILLYSVVSAFGQVKKYRQPADDSTLNAATAFTIMPYNRMIASAGKVVRYGNPQLENHTLDIALLPDKKNMIIEDRYGIALFNIASGTIKHRWAFESNATYKNLMSTYSGIKAFIYEDTTFIVWGATSSKKDDSYIVTACLNSDTLQFINATKITTIAPAANAIPNDIAITFEDGLPFLYTVLNGNNQLIKIGFNDKQIVWTAATGVAPYGVRIIDHKAYVTNWAGQLVTDTTQENAGTPWGSAYTNPTTGATGPGSLSIINIDNGKLVNELPLGLHPTAVINSPDKKYLYITNGNSDYVSVVNVQQEQVIDSIQVGLFSKGYAYYGSSPNGLVIDAMGTTLYVANGLDNAVAAVKLGQSVATNGTGKSVVSGYIPTEAYPSGVALVNGKLYITNLEAKGANVLSEAGNFKKPDGKNINAYSIHKQLASISIIPVPTSLQLATYTEKVKKLNLTYRLALTNQLPRKGRLPQPLPERIGEPSLFKHVVYIIKENKTYDQVFGDLLQGRGDKNLCIYGDSITPNQHRLAKDFSLLDNYYASGKSSAEGHQWTDAAMVSDYIEKNVRAWFRSYPHRQADALVYNKSGFIWNNALDNGKTVRIYGEACTTEYDSKLNWFDIYDKYLKKEPIALNNTSTIARIRPVLAPTFPDCDNLVFPDQLRAQIFIDEWKKFESAAGDSLPNLMVLSLPNDHSAGTSPNFPTPRAMVADNDLALGRIIETITHSRFWDSTVVFVTEDDSQSGWDHISSYRTTCLIISPYSNLKKTIHTNYNQTSMVRTIEQILGIPPMNIIDATALPMFDCFSSTKSLFAYNAIPNKVPLNERNKPLTSLKGKALMYAKLSANAVFNEVDGGEDDTMNRILWFDAKGLQKYPGVVSKD